MNCKKIDQNLNNVKELCYEMLKIADRGDNLRKDSGCGAIYGYLRDSAYKIRKLVDEEIKLHKLQIKESKNTKGEEPNEYKKEDPSR